VTSVSIIVPGGGLPNCGPVLAKNLVLILFFTTTTPTLGLKYNIYKLYFTELLDEGNYYTAVFALKNCSPTCLKAKFRNIFYLFKQKSFIIFTCPNQVLPAEFDDIQR
jgi:hypothetical protein